MPLYNSWHSGVRHVPRRETVIACMNSIPGNQCCGCGRKRRLSSHGGVKHCGKTTCFNRAKRIAMGEA